MKIATVIGILETERTAPGMEDIRWVQVRTDGQILTAADPIGAEKGQLVLIADGAAAERYRMDLLADALVAAVLNNG